ncbi:MAG: hypothetical protein NT027_12660 [Proteobacteria bacterium]|nr:hypothetical protein [Pseudomonadota bacterium]
MLKIQLCPIGELENKQWWIPDAASILAVLLVSWIGLDQVIGSVNEEIVRLNVTADDWTGQIAKLNPLIEKYKGLDAETAVLKKKIDVISRITVNKMDKVLPLVVLEQLQILKPAGLWYRDLEFLDDKKVKINAASRESLLVSEFLLGLRETMNPATWNSDIRTQIGYQNVQIGQISRVSVDANFKDQTDILEFDVVADIAEKQPPVSGALSAVPRPRRIGQAVF